MGHAAVARGGGVAEERVWRGSGELGPGLRSRSAGVGPLRLPRSVPVGERRVPRRSFKSSPRALLSRLGVCTAAAGGSGSCVPVPEGGKNWGMGAFPPPLPLQS